MNTTIIDGGNSGDVVRIADEWIKIKGFTIQNSGDGFYDAGIDIDIDCNKNIITGNTISNNSLGIHCYCDNGIYNTISDNTISNNGIGICGTGTIKSNTISNNGCGIQGHGKIKGNNISNNGCGIYGGETIKNNIISNNGCGIHGGGTIKGNIILNNEYGINLSSSYFNYYHKPNTIKKNNFIDNTRDAFFFGFSFLNFWRRNYWDEPRNVPKVISGEIRTIMLFSVYIQWFDFDWFPAKEPYDIKVGI